MSSLPHPITLPSADRWSTEVLPLLPADLEAQAFALGALRRKRAFPSASLLLRGLLAYALQAGSFALLGAWGVLSETVDIAASSWLKRLRAADPWLAWLLDTLLGARPAPWLCAFERWQVKLIDISSIGRHGGTGDDWRLQLSYDLLHGRFDFLTLSDRSEGEQLDGMRLQQGDIAVVDAGYGRRQHIAAVVAQLADIVVRLYLPTCPLLDRLGRPLDLVQQLARRGSVPLEVPALLQYGEQSIAVRVIALPLSADQAHAARRRLRRNAQRKGRTPSATGLLLAGWLVLLTTLPSEPWEAATVVALYRARWQIELLFKRLKQLLRLQQLRCSTAASALPLLRLYLLAWVISSDVATESRVALQQAAAPAPATLPGAWPAGEAVVSSWRVSQLGLDLLRQQVWGQWTAERLRRCLRQLVRHLVTHPRERGREHQESVIRARLTGRRLTPPRPLLEEGE
jgi:hypothetical protein